MLNKFKPKEEFSRNVLTLMTGTVIAQALPILIAPALTRIYSPEDFGLFALYSSILSILAVIATGRYEAAIMNPSQDEDARSLVILSIIIAACFCLILAIHIYFFNDDICFFLKNSQIKEWLYFLPFSVFLMGAYQVASYWLNRKKNYRQLSTNKILQAGTIAIIQFSEGAMKVGAVGLLTGMLSGWFISLLSMIPRISFKKYKLNFDHIKKLAVQYRQYPLLQAPTSLLNTVSSQAPVFFLTQSFSPVDLGFYNLTAKVLTAPAAVISRSIGQVYFQRVSEFAQTAPQKLVHEILLTTKKLLALSIVIFSPLLFFGKELFAFVFGSSWSLAGLYSEILSPAIAIKFVVSPLSTIFLATNKIGLGSFWQTLYFITSMTILFIGSKYSLNIFLWIYTFHEITLYILYFCLMLIAAKSFSQRG